MARRNNNMNNVPAFGEALAEGCYQFRLDRVEDDGANNVRFFHKCQTEPFVGRQVMDNFQMDNEVALSKLRAYYNAAGYQLPEDGSHDPEEILGFEFYAVIVHNTAKGGTVYANIAPWSITSLEVGPIQALGPAA